MLPFLLTGFLLLFHRAATGRRRWKAPSAAAPRQLLVLSFIAILSHPLLDTLNTYGVRWLMPFSDRWFYGDTLFIIDPWIWLALSLGLYYSARRARAKRSGAAKPVWLALGLVTLYSGAMAIAGAKARDILLRDVAGAGPVHGAMAGPVPLDPSVRKFVIEQQEQYRVGTFRWLDRPHVVLDQVRTFPRGRPSHPAFTAAAESPLGRRFLGWARYPTAEVQQVGRGRFLVHLLDLRYAQEPGERFGAISIPVTLPPGSGTSAAPPSSRARDGAGGACVSSSGSDNCVVARHTGLHQTHCAGTPSHQLRWFGNCLGAVRMKEGGWTRQTLPARAGD